MATVPTFVSGQPVTAAALSFLADPPRMSAVANAAQSVPNGLFTGLALQTELEDNDAMFTPGDSYAVIKTPGRWLFTYTAPWSANASGSRLAGLFRNGVEVHRLFVPAAAPPWTTDLSTSAVLRCSVNDTVQLVGYQTSGGALSTGYSVGSGAIAQLSGQWLGK